MGPRFIHPLEESALLGFAGQEQLPRVLGCLGDTEGQGLIAKTGERRVGIQSGSSSGYQLGVSGLEAGPKYLMTSFHLRRQNRVVEDT